MDPGSATTSDPRALRREFQAITQGTKRFVDPSEVISTYTEPLSRLFGGNSLPDSLKTTPQLLSTCSSGSKAESVDVLLIEAVQESLLLRTCVDWAASLDSTQLQDLVQVWIFGPSSAGYDGVKGAMQQCGMRTITRLLSASVHPLTMDCLKTLCVSALTHLSLPALMAAVVEERNKARADVVWSEMLRLISSLPDRLANATRGQLPEGFSASMWVEKVLVGGMAASLQDSTLDGRRLRLLKDVLSRLDRLGYLSRAVDSDGCGFWVALLRYSLLHEGVAQNWSRLRGILGRNLRVKLDISLVETLQYLAARNGAAIGLITAGERARPGSEGTAFLGKPSHAFVGAIAHILDILFKQKTGTVEEESDVDSDTDTDSGSVSRKAKTFTSTALFPVAQSPLLAWAWATYLSTEPPTSILSCMESVLDRWSDSARISRSVLSEEVFLTTLITCLLSTLHESTSTSSATASQLAELSRSRTVLDGVSAHLAHPDPTTRRMGMLVAELLSAKTSSGGGGSDGGKTKTLNFGSGIWNGTGQGREEARVLRALGDAWEFHARAVEGVRREWGTDQIRSAVQALGIGQVGKEDTNETMEGRGVMTTLEKKKSKSTPPKTRSLPRRVNPPSRDATKARPLITMIDDSDGYSKTEQPPPHRIEPQPQPSPLTMFSRPTHPSSRPTRPSESTSSSSSDDSDSDSAVDSRESTIHRLAAELSGLSPCEAGNILNTSPLTSATSKSARGKASGKIDDFDGDRESHAPQFTKKTSPPVYISQLSPLLRSSDRSCIRLALHHASPLIRRKSSTALFGAEVAENAVDLTLSLVALHDNFGIKGFERLRRDALTALAVAQCQVTVSVLVEQVFGSQYSNAQRVGMLGALVESALELSGKKSEGENEMERRVDKVVAGVIEKARAVGEDKVPALKRERDLKVSNPRSTSGQRGLIQEITTTTSSSLSRRTTQMEHLDTKWSTLAGSVYLFPLINRYLSYQEHFSSSSRTRSYLGAGTASLFTSDSHSIFLDTLTLLVNLTPFHVLPLVTASLLEVISISFSPRYGSDVDATRGALDVTASSLNLLAVLLHANIEADGGKAMIQDTSSVDCSRILLGGVQEMFTLLQASDGVDGEKQGGGVRGKILSRAATVLLLMDQVDAIRQEAIRRSIGFVPV
ncbi:uncharacterized protein UTRI_03243_B [Ustilago trichophora]|uniref:Telomere length regulation protein conserved domain-containing protein n=1 Tax=Ustilago trichophora TaxID=86804 RepID=A0A5C3E5H0_9BASI|nr:uncharacterized protein UTRI_03243_B [Ustilago trichophora]